MNDLQTEHITALTDQFKALAWHKYSKGADEYGTNLWEYAPDKLLDEAIYEAVDQVIYLLTLKNNLKNYRPVDIKPVTKDEWVEDYHASRTDTEADTETA